MGGGEHGSPVQRGSRRGGFGSMSGIDPYTVGADSISARKLCGCRYVPRATNGRPYMCYDKNGLFSLNGFGDGIGVASLAGVVAASGITAA